MLNASRHYWDQQFQNSSGPQTADIPMGLHLGLVTAKWEQALMADTDL